VLSQELNVKVGVLMVEEPFVVHPAALLLMRQQITLAAQTQ